MKIVMKMLAAFAMFLMVSCASNTPTALADDAAGYLQDQDYESLVDMLYASDDKEKKGKEGSADFLRNKVFASIEEKGGIDSYEIGEEKVYNRLGVEYAVVKVKFVYGNGDSDDGDLKFVKKGEEWVLTIL